MAANTNSASCRTQSRRIEGSLAVPEPVAIVGMGCRLPGGVRSPSQLWDFLASGKTGLREFESDRINLEGYYHKNSNRPGSLHTRAANLLDEDPRLFDHRLFGLKDGEVKTMDPNQRKMLEVAYEAFESAGEPWAEFSGSKTGVFIGNFNTDYHLNQMYDIDFALPYTATGGSTSILSNRVNHVFNLRGPSVTVDTACSSSMYALHLAVAAIRNGDCDAAIVGGSNLILSPEMQSLTGSLGALSATSTCHTFDAAADGYGRGEGFGALYLKRHSDAVQGQYPIRAIIRATAINSNGRTAGISHPGVEGQEALIRQAYESVGLSPKDTGYFECHGTGTPVGDPVEVSAIGRVFASTRTHEDPLLIGSVKTNLGHSESASGITGVIKCVLALEKELIPPTIGVANLNPNIDVKAARVKVVTELTPWPSHLLKRASINSFGYGGANAHCIIERSDTVRSETVQASSNDIVSFASHLMVSDHPTYLPVVQDLLRPLHVLQPSVNSMHDSYIEKSTSVTTSHDGSQCCEDSGTESAGEDTSFQRNLVLVTFSGHDEDALRNNMLALKGSLSHYPLANIAYTLSQRSKFLFKSFCIADSRTVLETYTPEKSVISQSGSSHIPRLGFIFTGQGAQWQSMGRSLFAFKTFRSSLMGQDDVLRSLTCKPPWSIVDILSGASDLSVQDAQISQTICSALQLGLVDLLHSWKIEPHVVVGHSSGEIAAAYAAGYISRAEAIATAYCRGIALSKNTNKGAMMAVGLSIEDCRVVLTGKNEQIKIAAVNSPSSITLSGDEPAIEELHKQLQSDGHFSRLLKTGGNAYHSHHMKAVGEYYEQLLSIALEDIRRTCPFTTDADRPQHYWVSSVTPGIKTDLHDITPAYWRQNLESSVNFAPAVSDMISSPATAVDILVEIGPHSALQGPLNQIISARLLSSNEKQTIYISALKRFENGEKNILELCGTLFCNSYPVDLKALLSRERLINGKVQYESRPIIPDLPTYQYTYGPIICHESRIGREIRMRKFLRHDLLGSLQPGCARDRPCWRNILRLKDLPWLNDHKLLPNAVLPGSAYVCIGIEAVSQYLHGRSELLREHCFKLRNVSIKSAMRIPDDDTGLEIVVNLNASSGNPNFYEFNVASVSKDGATWTEHGSGLISVSSSTQSPRKRLGANINRRFIEAEDWYSHFTEAGLGYGPSFSDLRDITSDPYKDVACAKVGLQTTRPYFTEGPESEYAIHPASLDLCHQLALIACHGGQTGRFRTAFIPVSIEEITVWPSVTPTDEWGEGNASGQLRGLRGAHANVQLFTQSGKPLVQIRNLKCVSYFGGNQISKPDVHEYTRLAWKPDISSLSNNQANTLFPPLVSQDAVADTFEKMEQMSMYMLIELNERFGTAAPEAPHLQRFLRWVSRAANVDLSLAVEARSMTNTERQSAIQAIISSLPNVIDVQFAKRIFDNMDKILSGETTGVEVALQGDILNKVYTTGLGISAAYPQLARLLDLLGHRNPSMKILEVGAGTGAATDIAMRTLAPEGSPKRYGSYTFTDVSTAFLGAAQTQFANHRSMTFESFDMNACPQTQGFDADYDLIIASECIHATRNIDESLKNLRALLKPEGKLILLETTQGLLGHNIVYGTFPDWWNDDEARDTPFLSREEWQQALQKNGFSGIDIELSDYEAPYKIVSTIFTSAVASETNLQEEDDSSTKVHIVTIDPHCKPHEDIGDQLRQRKLSPVFQRIGSEIPAGCRVILCLDSNYSLADADEEQFMQLKAVVRQASSILWVSIGDTLEGRLPRSATTTGLVRMLTTEMPEARHGIFMLERASNEEFDANIIDEIVNREIRIHNGDFDRELAVKDSIVNICRLVFDEELNARYRDLHIVDDKPRAEAIHRHDPVVADFKKPGLISSLYFRQDESALEPLPADFIEIRTGAMGLNWKDLAVSTGRNDMNYFSAEASGTVARIGTAVENFKPGDRIYALAWGKFGNTLRLPAKMAQMMRNSDHFEDMAAVPMAFCTAHYGLNHLGRLQRGERVLIQGATGGVGLAAIQIARHIGAEIYGTAGTEAKIEYLVEQCQIQRERIFSSRDERDLQRVIPVTNGHGFDVILSASTGSMMHESWRHLAPRGRFIDVGRLDVQNGATLAMEVFKRNAVYASFDLSIMANQDLDFCASLMNEVGDMLRSGSIRPITPLRTFDVSELESALLHFSQGKHIGKIAVTYNNEQSLVKMIRTKPSARFDTNSLYILVGGLGGFGRGILEWMVARGARNIAVWSRSGTPPEEASVLISELAHRKVNISIVRCDITSISSIDSAIAQATLPIKGILHAAVTFCDQAFEILPYNQWKLGISAKVTGTENLHEATIKHALDLDFFVMTSSYEAVVALPTQAAYCAANSFQDAFARYRRAQGLPACAIALGLITEIGEVGQRDITRTMIDRNNLYGTGELGTLRLLEAAFLEAPLPQAECAAAANHWRHFDPLAEAQITTCLEPYKLAQMLTKNGTERGVPRWMTDKKFSHLVQAANDMMSGTSEAVQSQPLVPEVASVVTTALSEGRHDDARKLVLTATKEKVAMLLRIPVESIEGTKSVAEYGVDSLIAVELRSWFVATFQSAVPLLRLLDESIPMRELAAWIVEEVQERMGV